MSLYELNNQILAGDFRIIVAENIDTYIVRDCTIQSALSIENVNSHDCQFSFENLQCNKLILSNINLSQVSLKSCNITELELISCTNNLTHDSSEFFLSKLIIENNTPTLPEINFKSLEIRYLGLDEYKISILDKTLIKLDISADLKSSLFVEILRSNVKQFSLQNVKLTSFYISHSSEIQSLNFNKVEFLTSYLEIKNDRSQEIKFDDCVFYSFTVNAKTIEYLYLINCKFDTVALKIQRLEFLCFSENEGKKIQISGAEINKIVLTNKNNTNIDITHFKIVTLEFQNLINFSQINLFSPEKTFFKSIKILGSDLRDTRFFNINFNESNYFELVRSNILDAQFNNCILPTSVNSEKDIAQNAFTKYDIFPENVENPNSLIHSFSETKEAYRQLKIVSEKHKDINNQLYFKSCEYQTTSSELSLRLSMPLRKIDLKTFIKKIPENFKKIIAILIPKIKHYFFIFLLFLKRAYIYLKAQLKYYLPIVKRFLIKAFHFTKKILYQTILFIKKTIVFIAIFIKKQILKLLPIINETIVKIKVFFKKESFKQFIKNLYPNLILFFSQSYIYFAENIIESLHFRITNGTKKAVWSLSIVKILGRIIIFLFNIFANILRKVISIFIAFIKIIYIKIAPEAIKYKSLSKNISTQNIKEKLRNVSHSPIFQKAKNILQKIRLLVIKFYTILIHFAKKVVLFLKRHKNFFLYIKLVAVILPEIIILKLNRISTNHGKNWLQGVIFTLSVLFISFYVYCRVTFGSENAIFGLHNFLNYLESFPILKLSDIEENYKIGDNGFIVLISRIFAIYGVYQIIAAFRKYKK